MKNVPYAPISDICFTAPATKKIRLLKGSKHPEHKIVLPSPPSQAKISNFFQELSKTGKPVLLSIIPEYCDDYIVDHSQCSLPLSNLFDPEAKLSYTDLLLKCEDILQYKHD